jgi:hypothetical protein
MLSKRRKSLSKGDAAAQVAIAAALARLSLTKPMEQTMRWRHEAGRVKKANV